MAFIWNLVPDFWLNVVIVVFLVVVIGVVLAKLRHLLMILKPVVTQAENHDLEGNILELFVGVEGDFDWDHGIQ